MNEDVGSQPSRILMVLGDSHVRPLRIAAKLGLLGAMSCRIEEVGGATAVGLRHPTSKTQALAAFRSHLVPYRRRLLPVFQLGEVDCGFVIWLRAQRYGETIQQQLNASLSAYGEFLLSMQSVGYADLIVTSAMLPTIRDNQADGEVNILRKEVKATLRERTDLTMDYNDRLHQFCLAHGLKFVDFTPDIIDPVDRLVADHFRHPDKKDHHLHPERMAHLWAQRLLESIGGHDDAEADLQDKLRVDPI